MDRKPSVEQREKAHALHHVRGIVEFGGVSFAYPGKDEQALADISLRISSGETLALVGVSGAGKSTVAKLLLRFYDPSNGTVRSMTTISGA